MIKRIIDAAELVNYNANARGNNSSDCVARGLSLAFNIGYDEMLKQLRATQKNMNSYSYKITPVIRAVINQNHPDAKQEKANDLVDPTTGEILQKGYPKVSEFLDVYSKGTVIILCGPKADGHSSHLVTAIDGKLYDTWDSRNYYVASYWAITDITYDFSFDLDAHKEQLRDQLYRDVDFFGTKYCTKYDIPVEEITVVRSNWSANVLSIIMKWISKKTNKTYDFSFKLSYNPRWSLDDAVKYTTATVKTRLYDRFYTAVKQDKDIEEANKFLQETGEKPTDLWLFDGREKRFFNSLPAKIKPFVEYLNIENPGEYSDSVYVRIRALPGDPKRTEEPKVRFRFYDSASVKAMIDRYLKTWEHPEVDYEPSEEY